MTKETLPKLATFKTFAEFRLALINVFEREQIDSDAGSMDMSILEWAFDAIEENAGFADADKAFFEYRLESIDCAGCLAPDGLIYNHDIAAKVPAWWNEIDSAMDGYHESTGEWFKPETVCQLVWFAVEYRASATGKPGLLRQSGKRMSDTETGTFLAAKQCGFSVTQCAVLQFVARVETSISSALKGEGISARGGNSYPLIMASVAG